MNTAAENTHREKEELAAGALSGAQLPEGYALTVGERVMLTLKCYSISLFSVSPANVSTGPGAPTEVGRRTRDALVRAAYSHERARRLARREDRELRGGDYRGATATAAERVTHQNAYHAALRETLTRPPRPQRVPEGTNHRGLNA